MSASQQGPSRTVVAVLVVAAAAAVVLRIGLAAADGAPSAGEAPAVADPKPAPTTAGAVTTTAAPQPTTTVPAVTTLAPVTTAAPAPAPSVAPEAPATAPPAEVPAPTVEAAVVEPASTTRPRTTTTTRAATTTRAVTTTAPATTRASTAVTAPATIVRVSGAFATSGKDDGLPVDRVTSLPAGAPQACIFWTTTGIPAGTDVDLVWTVDGRVLAAGTRRDFRWAAADGERVNWCVSVARSSGGLPRGTHALRLVVGGGQVPVASIRVG